MATSSCLFLVLQKPHSSLPASVGAVSLGKGCLDVWLARKGISPNTGASIRCDLQAMWGATGENKELRLEVKELRLEAKEWELSNEEMRRTVDNVREAEMEIALQEIADFEEQMGMLVSCFDWCGKC